MRVSFEKQNQIGTVGDQLAKTLLGEGGKGLGDSVARDILTQHFSDDDTRHTDLRNEFRKVAGEDKKTTEIRLMESSLNSVKLF